MSISFSVNSQNLIDVINKLGNDVMRVLSESQHRGMRFFEGYIIKHQMSGRPGLRRRTGNLARKFKTVTRQEQRDYVTRLADGAGYGIYHQYGTKRIPKRLTVYEDFKVMGRRQIEEYMVRDLSKRFKVAL